MGIEEVLLAPRSTWQRAYVEPVIGTIRRECLNHVIVFSERSLHQHVQAFTTYYHRSRTHLGRRRTRLSLARCSHLKMVQSLSFPRLAVFTIATNAGLLKREFTYTHEISEFTTLTLSSY